MTHTAEQLLERDGTQPEVEAATLRTEAAERRANLDEAIAELLARRMAACRTAAGAKVALGLPRRNLAREQRVQQSFVAIGAQVGLERDVASGLILGILAESNRQQSSLSSASLELPAVDEAQHIIDAIRAEIDEIDEIIAQLLGERQLVTEAVRESALALGRPAYDLHEQQAHIAGFIDLATAGGMSREFAQHFIGSLTRIQVTPLVEDVR